MHRMQVYREVVYGVLRRAPFHHTMAIALNLTINRLCQPPDLDDCAGS